MRTHRLSLLLLVVFGLLVYANGFQGSFHFDDSHHIGENRAIQDLDNLPSILAGMRGLPMATFALNYAVGGLHVFGYHLVNIALHILNAILVYWILTYTLNKKGENDGWGARIAFFSALLFVVHPIHTQALNLIIQRLEIMASTFYLLAILLFIMACQAKAGGKMMLAFVAVFIAYLLGLKSKEVAITLPAALLLYDFFFVAEKSIFQSLRRWPIHAALFVAGIWQAFNIMGQPGISPKVKVLPGQEMMQAGFSVQGITPWEYFLTQTNVLIHYLSLILFPFNQNLDYDFPVARSLLQTPVLREGTILNFILLPPILAILFLGGLVVWAIILGRKGSHPAQVVSFCVLMYFIVLSPTSSFVPIIDVIYEHRAYLASVFVIVPLVIALDWLGGRLFEGRGQDRQEAGHPQGEPLQSQSGDN